jgi:hypothetical protein
MHIVEMARAMLNEKNLPIYFWAEVIAIVVYVMYQTPTTIHGQETRCLTLQSVWLHCISACS